MDRSQPYVGYLKTIGAKTIVLDKTHKRGKFQPKGDEYILVGYSEESKAYRLWKRRTKIIIKVRDVKFFERPDRDETSEKDVLVTPGTKRNILDISLQNSPRDEDSDSEESRNENYMHDEEEEREEEEEEYDQDREEHDENVGEKRRGPGRPKLLRTGQRGRPKKMYQSKKANTVDPDTVSDALNGDNREA